VWYGKSVAPLFELPYEEKILICQATPGSKSGSTSTCPWLCSEGMLPANLPAYKFGFILAILSVLSSIAASRLPLFNEWILPSKCSCFQ